MEPNRSTTSDSPRVRTFLRNFANLKARIFNATPKEDIPDHRKEQYLFAFLRACLRHILPYLRSECIDANADKTRAGRRVLRKFLKAASFVSTTGWSMDES